MFAFAELIQRPDPHSFFVSIFLTYVFTFFYHPEISFDILVGNIRPSELLFLRACRHIYSIWGRCSTFDEYKGGSKRFRTKQR